METAGIALGAVALLPVVVDGYQRCLMLFGDVRSFSSSLGRSREQFVLQRNLFHQECRLLLRIVVSDEVANAMTDDKDHPNWKSPPFTADWSQRLGSHLDLPIKHVQESLEAIERILEKADKEKHDPV